MCENTMQPSVTRKDAGRRSSTAQPSNSSCLEHTQQHTTKNPDSSAQILSHDEENSRSTQRSNFIQGQARTTTKLQHVSPNPLARHQPPSDTMRIPSCMINESDILILLSESATSPPCTIETLRELDVPAIENNLNLRIDICYDQDLYFQPISGQKGDAKRIEGEKYWLSLAAEFRIYGHDAQVECDACGKSRHISQDTFQPRLPTLFSNLKEIVQMLVPETEHGEITEQLDIELLMQQVRRGSFDVLRLSKWLTSLLTLHCAPMRDHIAGEVIDLIQDSVNHKDMQMLVTGIEKLFGLLEAMKLDIANHQIRTSRYNLINESTDIQRRCFDRAIQDKQIIIESSQLWFQKACLIHRHSCTASERRKQIPNPFHGFLHAMVRLCNPSVKKVPTTFQYDHHRFVRLQEDLQDLVHIKLCLEVFNRRVCELAKGVRDCSTVHESLKSRIIFLTEDEEGNGGSIADHLDSIGIELTRAAIDLVASQFVDYDVVAEHEFQRTQDLLHNVFQYEDIHQRVTNNYLSYLESCTVNHAEEFWGMCPLDISNNQRNWTQARTAAKAHKPLLLADWEDMARRLAHIGVLHWRVWAELCYLKTNPMNAVPEIDSSFSSAISSDVCLTAESFANALTNEDIDYDDISFQPLKQRRYSSTELIYHQISEADCMYNKGMSDTRMANFGHSSNAHHYHDTEITTEEDVPKPDSDLDREGRSFE